MKILLLLTSVFIFSLLAQEATDEQLYSIYKEAILFVVIFGTMGLISYIYSTKHAKEYIPEELEEESSVELESFSERRVRELSELLESGIVTLEEYELLVAFHKNKS